MSDKQKQIEEMARVVFEYVDTKNKDKVYILHSRVHEDMKPFTHNYGVAEALYNAGCRKTFTSEFASDTQRAFKKGYILGVDLCADSINDIRKQAVKEFIEKLKSKMGEREYMGVKYKQGVFSDSEIDEIAKELREVE